MTNPFPTLFSTTAGVPSGYFATTVPQPLNCGPSCQYWSRFVPSGLLICTASLVMPLKEPAGANSQIMQPFLRDRVMNIRNSVARKRFADRDRVAPGYEQQFVGAELALGHAVKLTGSGSRVLQT